MINWFSVFMVAVMVVIIVLLCLGGDQMNIHSDCENYSPKKDYCLKFFEENVSEKYKVCKEYSEFNDKELSRKWSN